MIEATIALVLATVALLGSPGPATLSLAALGASAGFRKSLPYLCGILLGLFVAMIGAVIGVATVFANWPGVKWLFQLLGALYIFYVAYKIATADTAKVGNESTHELPGFRDGLILNLLNAKAYIAFFALFSQFLLPASNTLLEYVMTSTVIISIMVIVDSLWLMLGAAIRPLFARPRAARVLNVTFAVIIVVATLWALLGQH